ncbi:hypothetical protein Tco_1184173 [Tanacetum coccineum]
MQADLKYVESLEDEIESDKMGSLNYNAYIFIKSEKDSISLEIALQQCQEQLKNDTVCKEKAQNKLLEMLKGKYVDTKFDKPSVVRQPNAQRIPKPSVLGKPAPFSDSLERKNFAKKKSVSKTNESEGLSKPITLQNLPRTAMQATSRNTNPRVSTSTRVAHRTNVSRPQPRSNQIKDKVLPNTSQVKFKKTEVEDHLRNTSISNQTKSVTACNDSLNSRTSNINAVCATCGKCVFNSNHDACVSKFLNDVNARTKKPNVVPISTTKPKSQVNKSVATPHKKIAASESTTTNSKSYYRMLYKKTSRMHKAHDGQSISASILLKNIWVYYVEGLNHNLFSIGQFCDADLEVAFRKSTCFVRYLQGNDLLTGNHGTRSLYIISSRRQLQSTPICLMAKASPTQADGDNLDKVKEKGDPCILVGYSTQSKGYRVYNKRTRLIVESIHLRFDEIKEMFETSVANDTSGLVPQ